MRKLHRSVAKAALAVGALTTAVATHAAADTNLTAQIATFDSGFSAIQTVVLGVLGFGITIGLIKWLRPKKGA